VPVAGRRALDVGASTGGFTDCLLQRGAAAVVAVDVGYGQLHERLRADPRVEVHERTNARDLRPGDLGPPAELLVGDLSFISLRTVLPSVIPLVVDGADVVVLVKPQFEAGREEAARGRGVITDPAIWRRVLAEVSVALEATGTAIMGAMASPLTGADGNVEFLLHARTGTARPAVGAALDAAVAEARDARL
jgi:23S rRNA (cytidine1920-2'-O)/16S rRNA (cytidine1409-2'-O)-methyltransferase